MMWNRSEKDADETPDIEPAPEQDLEQDPGPESESFAEGAHDSTPGDDVSEAEAIRQELEEARDRHLRLAAEFENYRKRTRQELGQSGVRAQASLIGSLMEVSDDIDRFASLDAGQVTAESILEGMQLVQRKLDRVLTEAGLEVVEAEGAVFDPETMEAVLRVPTDSDDEDDQVAQVLQKGVIFKGHLVRPARVSVKKAD